MIGRRHVTLGCLICISGWIWDVVLTYMPVGQRPFLGHIMNLEVVKNSGNSGTRAYPPVIGDLSTRVQFVDI